jgi:hypothetical protein
VVISIQLPEQRFLMVINSNGLADSTTVADAMRGSAAVRGLRLTWLQ